MDLCAVCLGRHRAQRSVPSAASRWSAHGDSDSQRVPLISVASRRKSAERVVSPSPHARSIEKQQMAQIAARDAVRDILHKDPSSRTADEVSMLAEWMGKTIADPGLLKKHINE